MNKSYPIYPILITIFISAILTVLPLSQWLSIIRPNFIVMTCLFWMLILPQYYGVVFAWFSGIVMDVCFGVLLGQNALALIIVAMICYKVQRRFKLLNYLHKSLIILLMVGVYKLIILWIQTATSEMQLSSLYMLPAVTSAIVWPAWSIAMMYVKNRWISYHSS